MRTQQTDINNTKRLAAEWRSWEMVKEFSHYDAADYLETEENIRLYLEVCREEGDLALVAAALDDIARARNMTQLAKEAGMTRAGLYKALSAEGNPSFATISKVAKAQGLKITVHPARGLTPMMQFNDFEIGSDFDCGGKRWKCTDLGQRVVVAIPTDEYDDLSWLNGPPYAIAETVFDEYDVEGCSPIK